MESSVLHSVKSLLHSLSPRNFQETKHRLLDCVGRSQSQFVLQGLVDSIFEMAQVEEDSTLLGLLCSELDNKLPYTAAVDESTGKVITFRRLLLNKLQLEFESAVPETEDAVVSEDDESLRPRLLGSVRLLAELFRHKMLTERICHAIIRALLESTNPPDVYIEAVYQFCNSIGKLLDGNGKAQEMFDGYFKRLIYLTDHPQRTEELRLKIHELIQMRSNKWVIATAGSSNLSSSYGTMDMESSSENEGQGDFEDVFEQLEKAMNALKISQEKAQSLRNARAAAELEASNVKLKVRELERQYNEELKRGEEAEGALEKEREELKKTREELEICKEERDSNDLLARELESRYSEELKRREETEDALAREREALEMTRQELEIFKKERDDNDLLARELESRYSKELKQREETEDALAREREALEMTRQELEIFKKERDDNDLLARELETRYSEELKRREETEDALAREMEALEVTRQELEIFKKQLDDLQVERDNAFEVTEDLLRHKEEETSLLAFARSEQRPTPESFICPISQEVMNDPHVAADGFTYEAEEIRQWLDSGRDTSPMTNLPLSHRNLVPNHTLRAAIGEWFDAGGRGYDSAN